MNFKCTIDSPNCGGRCEHIPFALPFVSCINDEIRLRIICVLSNTEGYNVSQIVEAIEVPQNLASHHLKVLLEKSIIKKEKRGLEIFYTLNQEIIDEHLKSLRTLLNYNK